MSSNLRDPDPELNYGSECDEGTVTINDLIQAARYGILEDVETLIFDYGVDIDGLDVDSKWTALHNASFNGHKNVVRFLVENGADVTKQSESLGFQQWSAIHFASERGQKEIVEILLSNGATVNDREHENKAPIHIASEKGHTELVEFLLANGATVHDRAECGLSPLHCACLYGQHEVVVTLLNNGARIDDRTDSDATPLNFACAGGHNVIVLTLLDHGADVNDYDFPRRNPLYSASQRGQHDVVSTLLGRGAQVKGRDFSSWNPLHPACRDGHYEVVRTLLNHRVDVHSYDDKGLTPLHNACNGISRTQFIPELCMSDKAYTLKVLLEFGIDPNVLDKEGFTPLERACDKEFPLYLYDSDMVSILHDYGAGSGVMCRVGKCGCNTTVLMCCYMFYRLLFDVSREREGHDTLRPLRDKYEMYFIKTQTARIYQCNDEKAVDPPERDIDWDQPRRDAYRTECQAEVDRMKSDTVGDTRATYYDLLTRNLTALRHQQILGQVTGDDCVQRYPNYGNMIYCSYIRLHRLFLHEESPGFFAIFSPPLLPECAEVVQNYLSDRDLENVIEVYRSYQRYLEKLSERIDNVDCGKHPSGSQNKVFNFQ